MKFIQDWEDVWLVLLFVTLVCLVSSCLIFAFHDHQVRSYYLELGGDRKGFCVMQSIDWDIDSIAFCTDDINKALDVLTKVNNSLKDPH